MAKTTKENFRELITLVGIDVKKSFSQQNCEVMREIEYMSSLIFTEAEKEEIFNTTDFDTTEEYLFSYIVKRAGFKVRE